MNTREESKENIKLLADAGVDIIVIVRMISKNKK